MPPAKSRISQETFDAAVQENIDEFEMEADEAVSSAVREFEMQGVDLIGIIKRAGGVNLDTHPVAVAVRQLEAAAAALPTAGVAGSELPAALAALLDALPPVDAEAVAVAGQKGAVAALLEAAQQLSRLARGAAALDDALPAIAQTCTALAAALQSDACRDAFEAGGGPRVLLLLLDTAQGQQGGGAVAAEAAHAAAAAAAGHEDNKCLVVDCGLAAALVAALRPGADAGSGNGGGGSMPSSRLITGVCAMICALCVSDDVRPLDVPGGRVPGGRAFQNARGLAADGGGIDGRGVATLVPLLRRIAAEAGSAGGAANGGHSQQEAGSGAERGGALLQGGPGLLQGGQVEVAVSLCGALKALAANDDICKDVEEAGGLDAAVTLWRHRLGSQQITAAAVGLCRQLANRDAVKAALAAAGAFQLAQSTAAAHSASMPVLEQVFGLVVAMTLRMPENAAAAVDAGCLNAIVDAMSAHADNPKSAAVQRQGCMAVRNICARSPDLRPAAVAAGAEAALRNAKAKFPSACGDVGSAALRDMGCDNYNGSV